MGTGSRTFANSSVVVPPTVPPLEISLHLTAPYGSHCPASRLASFRVRYRCFLRKPTPTLQPLILLNMRHHCIPQLWPARHHDTIRLSFPFPSQYNNSGLSTWISPLAATRWRPTHHTVSRRRSLHHPATLRYSFTHLVHDPTRPPEPNHLAWCITRCQNSNRIRRSSAAPPPPPTPPLQRPPKSLLGSQERASYPPLSPVPTR